MKRSKNSVYKLTLLSMLTAVAMLLSYVESLVPPLVAVPGVKIGFSNIATVLTLYTLGIPSAVAVSVVRVCLSALLFGNVQTLFFSLMGAAFALVIMSLMRFFTPFSEIGVSVAGGVFHNVGQILVAMLLLRTAELGYYLIVLSITGTISGILIGLCGGILTNRLKTNNLSGKY